MRKILGRITVVIFMMALLVAVPVRVDAASKLNCTKWEVTCADKGKTKNLKVTGSKNGKYKLNGNWYTIKWSSSNKSVASVDKNGKVKVGKGGSATITASIIYGSYGPKFTKDIGKCKVKVGHVYTKTTEHREPTLYKQGGDFEISTCSCGKTVEKQTKVKDFVYTEEFLLAEMDKIYRLSQEECKLVTEEIDYEGDVILHEGFRTTKDFLNFLIEEKYVPSSVLNVAKTTTATVRGFDYGKRYTGACEDSVHSFESILSGYQRYEPIRRYGGYGDKNFEMRSDLKAGDILKTERHTIIFTHYTHEGGKVFINGYTGANGEITKSSYECVGSKPNKENELGYMDDVTVYRLPNYK